MSSVKGTAYFKKIDPDDSEARFRESFDEASRRYQAFVFEKIPHATEADFIERVFEEFGDIEPSCDDDLETHPHDECSLLPWVDQVTEFGILITGPDPQWYGDEVLALFVREGATVPAEDLAMWEQGELP